MTDNDKLSNHVSQLLQAMSEREPRHASMRERTGTLPTLTAQAGPDELTEWAQQTVALYDEGTADIFHRVDVHAHAILKLTDDPTIVGPVRVIADRMAKECSDMHDVISEVERVASAADKFMVLMKLIGLLGRALPRQSELATAVARLERFSA
ncbi:hypothetical protein [Mycolicibacterium pulveris]|uniref:hypothetical protein n=1 Tax=Mycolicibacterium pulveris TaxID=36813 RepID=UPI003CF16DD1